VAWEIVAAIGSAMSGAAAAAGLLFVGLQIGATRKTNELQSLIQFNRDIDEQERAFFTVGHDESSEESANDDAYHSLLNLLEAYAAALNRKLLPKSTANFVQDKLLDAHVLIEDNPFWRDKRAIAKLHSATFSEWDKFVELHQPEVAIRRREIGK